MCVYVCDCIWVFFLWCCKTYPMTLVLNHLDFWCLFSLTVKELKSRSQQSISSLQAHRTVSASVKAHARQFMHGADTSRNSSFPTCSQQLKAARQSLARRVELFAEQLCACVSPVLSQVYFCAHMHIFWDLNTINLVAQIIFCGSLVGT